MRTSFSPLEAHLERCSVRSVLYCVLGPSTTTLLAPDSGAEDAALLRTLVTSTDVLARASSTPTLRPRGATREGGVISNLRRIQATMLSSEVGPRMRDRCARSRTALGTSPNEMPAPEQDFSRVSIITGRPPPSARRHAAWRGLGEAPAQRLLLSPELWLFPVEKPIKE